MTAPNRLAQLEALLADDPADSMTRYAVALEHAGLGDEPTACRLLSELIADDPNYVPAYLMNGQYLAKLGRVEEAVFVLERGVIAAHQAGNAHAAGEMQGLLATLD